MAMKKLIVIHKNYSKKIFLIILLGIGSYLTGNLYLEISEYYNTVNSTKKDTICPSLLSIARSARDTLIVMKAEPLCNQYVLENLW
jgi:hypothetical protein